MGRASHLGAAANADVCARLFSMLTSPHILPFRPDVIRWLGLLDSFVVLTRSTSLRRSELRPQLGRAPLHAITLRVQGDAHAADTVFRVGWLLHSGLLCTISSPSLPPSLPGGQLVSLRGVIRTRLRLSFPIFFVHVRSLLLLDEVACRPRHRPFCVGAWARQTCRFTLQSTKARRSDNKLVGA